MFLWERVVAGKLSLETLVAGQFLQASFDSSRSSLTVARSCATEIALERGTVGGDKQHSSEKVREHIHFVTSLDR